MKRLLLIGMVFVVMLGCATLNPNNPAPIQPEGSNQPEVNTQEEPAVEEPAPAETDPPAGSDCYAPEIHPVGQSIAEQFVEETSYNQIMGWFCNGALFDDILIALQTEKLSGESANELLEMQAGGLTWDQIWTEIGLTEE
ncbi:MAG: hypothetical protein ABFS17_04425 [Chloroflexota bacterium]